MTNREWINSLTDEQFVKFFRTFREDWCPCCADNYNEEEGSDCGFCFDGQVKWLGMEHDSEGWEERSYRFCV